MFYAYDHIDMQMMWKQIFDNYDIFKWGDNDIPTLKFTFAYAIYKLCSRNQKCSDPLSLLPDSAT